MPIPARKRRVLFLISDTGAGHRSAANAIVRAMERLGAAPYTAPDSVTRRDGEGTDQRSGELDGGVPSESWEATIVDAFKEYTRFPLRNGVFLYGPAIKHSPRLYGQVFRLTNTSVRFRAAYRLARPFFYQGMVRLLLEQRPDVIVSVHPLLNHGTLQVLRDLNVRVPFLTVVTDLVTIHCAWIAPDVTACVVPTEAARRMALKAGVPASRVHLLGMPIDPQFALPHAGSQAQLRSELGLDPDLPAVLVVGGGEGAIGLASAVTALAHSDLKLQLIVVTGRNARLLARLKRAQSQGDGFGVPAQILGFVRNMPDLMHVADVIVTKAGPGTVTEAMACSLPIVLTGAVPGQEEGNVDYVLGHDLGVLARSPGQVVWTLRELLTPGSRRLEQLRTNVRRMSRPKASFDIARLIFQHFPEPGAPSPWEPARRHDAVHGPPHHMPPGPVTPLPRVVRRSSSGRQVGEGKGLGGQARRRLLRRLREQTS